MAGALWVLGVGNTVDYEPFIKSQLASTESALKPCVVQIWSHDHLKFRGNETFAVHRVGRGEATMDVYMPGMQASAMQCVKPKHYPCDGERAQWMRGCPHPEP